MVGSSTVSPCGVALLHGEGAESIVHSHRQAYGGRSSKTQDYRPAPRRDGLVVTIMVLLDSSSRAGHPLCRTPASQNEFSEEAKPSSTKSADRAPLFATQIPEIPKGLSFQTLTSSQIVQVASRNPHRPQRQDIGTPLRPKCMLYGYTGNHTGCCFRAFLPDVSAGSLLSTTRTLASQTRRKRSP